MGRLEDKMAQVAGIAERVTKDMEARADAVIEREAKLVTRTKNYFGAKNTILDGAETALEKAERMLALLNNDPLPVSETSQADEKQATVPPAVGPLITPFQSS